MAAGIEIRGPTNHDSQKRDKILRIVLRPEIGQFFPHFGALSLANCTISGISLDRKEKIRWKIQELQ